MVVIVLHCGWRPCSLLLQSVAMSSLAHGYCIHHALQHKILRKHCYLFVVLCFTCLCVWGWCTRAPLTCVPIHHSCTVHCSCPLSPLGVVARNGSLVYNNSNTGRKAVADKMDEMVIVSYGVIVCMLYVLHYMTKTSVYKWSFVSCMPCAGKWRCSNARTQHMSC